MLEMIVISSLFIIGLHVAMWEGMILYRVRLFLDKLTESARIVRKPLYGCPPCMASVWGTVLWFAFGHGIEWKWLLFVVAVSGLNYFIISITGGEE